MGRTQVDRYLPTEAVAKAGLLHAQPPSVLVTVCASPEQPLPPPLLSVSATDLARMPMPHGAAGRALLGVAAAAGAGASEPAMAAELSAPPPPGPPCPALENARLKSELAGYIAAACTRELSASEAAGGGGGGGASDGARAAGSASRPPTAGGKAPASPSPTTTATSGGGSAPPDVVAALQRAVSLRGELSTALQKQAGGGDDVGVPWRKHTHCKSL